MKNKHLFAIGAVVVLTLACAVPGAVQPASIDPAMLPTIVALTVNAATTQTAAAAPGGQVPSGDSTLTPPPDVNETSLEPQGDGSVKFVHLSGGYEVTFPNGWLTVRPNSEEFDAAYSNDAAKNSMLLDQMNNDMANYDAEFDQLYSYVLRPDLEKDMLFGFSDVDWDPSDPNTIDEITMGKLIDLMESSTGIPGFRLDTAQIYETSNKIKLIELGGQFSISDGNDGVIPFYTTIVFFKPAVDSSVRMSFTYLKDYKLDIYTDVGHVISSIKLLGQ